MKKIVVGILAHVDAGKTTLSEAMLYYCGCIKTLGRVDHRNSFLDTYSVERERGITVFSKQAIMSLNDLQITLLDTPGHVDFSAEMERTLQVLDYAILVISGTDGVQSHTKTLWELLKKYNIPTFVFVNKMDLNVHNQNFILAQLNKELDYGCVNFENSESFYENIAECDEQLLEKYISGFSISYDDIANVIKNRKVYPCYFGSALKMTGIDLFMEGLSKFVRQHVYGNEFAAKVFKIARDAQGNRLTYSKITGGYLKTKDTISKGDWEEKVNQIRIYSGMKFKAVDEAQAGDVCAVIGLSKTISGDCLGSESSPEKHFIEPVFNYRVLYPASVNTHDMFLMLKELEEEDPLLHTVYNPHNKELYIQIMGDIQIEILKCIIFERFALKVDFDAGSIIYKETITNTVEGIGHFEPLRHYAEVHLQLEPLPVNSGVVFDSKCSEDELSRNWQRLILSNLEEKCHIGVLTGSPLTDIKITLIAGKAHEKHTEGGDFRQASFRAVRNGLMKANSVLLEPYYSFLIELPQENIGRAMTDIKQMFGTFEISDGDDGNACLIGTVPVLLMREYPRELSVYTKGKGRINLSLYGYLPCHNQDEVIKKIEYDAEADVENTPDSVFCSHGAGHTVKWFDVEKYAHIAPLKSSVDTQSKNISGAVSSGRTTYSGSFADDEELMAIYERTYGTAKYKDKDRYAKPSVTYHEIAAKRKFEERSYEILPEYLLIDGYNIIFAWNELKAIANTNLNTARNILIDIIINYNGYKKTNIIIVFDAYKVAGGKECIEEHNGVFVIYTKESQTADAYIEAATKKLVKNYKVKVATSDALIQTIIFSSGALRISADEFKGEICAADKEIADIIDNLRISPSGRNSKIRDIISDKKS